MKKIILILLIGIFMNPTFHLYGIKITLAGDLQAARDRAHLARLLMFKTKLVNVNNLDIIQNNLRLNDGTHVHFMSQHGFDSATIYVPPKPGKGKPEYIEKPMFEVIPYIFASNTVFERAGEPAAGLLVCHGGYDFSGYYELFSPFGDVADSDAYMKYQPYQYEIIDDEYVFYNYGDGSAGKDAEIIEWQVKEFYDYTMLVEREYETHVERLPVYWDEIPWMTSAGRWDPVFYETYDIWEAEFQADDGSVWTPSAFTKTYGVYNGYSGVTRAGDALPEFEVYSASWDVGINNGTVLESCSVRQWYTGDFEESTDWWYREGNSASTKAQLCGIDQESPSKFGVIWNSSSHTANCSSLEFRRNLWNIPNENTVTTDQKVTFTGLGHEEILPGTAATEGLVRLYKINDKYVCLFSYVDGSVPNARVYVGSAVEDGAFNVVDLTDGIMVNGELKHVLTRPDFPISFGILKRIEPTKRIKKEQ